MDSEKICRLIADSYADSGSIHATSRDLGMHRRRVRSALKSLGLLSPSARPVLEPATGQHVSGVSTLVRLTNDPDGKVLQWVKTSGDQSSKVQAFSEAIEAISRQIVSYPATVPPALVSDDLMCVIPIGDPHIGMLSWAAETGADWNLEIAERVIVSAVGLAVGLAPAAGKCLLINLGDYFHSDSQANRTAKSGHQLDVDGRWAKIIECGIRIQTRIIDLCLAKFGVVEMVNVRGNHDDHSSILLDHTISAYYRDEPRVVVNISPRQHRFFEFGSCLIGTHHGHLAKAESLVLLAAAQEPQLWGRTKYRRIYCGHVHHDRLREFPGCVVETFNTLAARDAYAAGAAYFSARDLKVDTWHISRGLINRSTVDIAHIDGSN